MDIELQGISDIVRTEIGIVEGDIERLNRQFTAATEKHALAERKLRKLAEIKAGLDNEATAAFSEMTTLQRVLKARRRTLFELKQEVE
jgi:predicted  nucleic acid-binding Zn-ribbon protein